MTGFILRLGQYCVTIIAEAHQLPFLLSDWESYSGGGNRAEAGVKRSAAFISFLYDAALCILPINFFSNVFFFYHFWCQVNVC